jgi:hypothetical protein
MSAKQPKWTLIYNTHPIGSRWVGSAYEFFDTEIGAANRYADLRAEGLCPTKRPYYAPTDQPRLGAVHVLNGEG